MPNAQTSCASSPEEVNAMEAAAQLSRMKMFFIYWQRLWGHNPQILSLAKLKEDRGN